MTFQASKSSLIPTAAFAAMLGLGAFSARVVLADTNTTLADTCGWHSTDQVDPIDPATPVDSTAVASTSPIAISAYDLIASEPIVVSPPQTTLTCSGTCTTGVCMGVLTHDPSNPVICGCY
jgi:hypothetical protein